MAHSYISDICDFALPDLHFYLSTGAPLSENFRHTRGLICAKASELEP